jgi:hypothetical protein
MLEEIRNYIELKFLGNKAKSKIREMKKKLYT